MEPRPLRIAMISLHSSPLGEVGTRDTGGMSIYIRRLAEALAARGHRVDIFTRRQHGGQEPVVNLTDAVRVIHLKAGGWEPLPPPALAAHVREFTIGLNRMQGAHGIAYDLVHSHYWLSGLVGRSVAAAWGAPHVVVFHTLGELKNRVFSSPVEPRVRLRSERLLCRESDRIIATTETEREALTGLYEAPSERVAVIPCGVDLTGFRPMNQMESRRLLGMPSGDTVLYVGRLDPVKGLEDLVAALPRVDQGRPLQLMVVGGDGDVAHEAGAVRELAARLQVSDRVTFAGRVPHEDLPAYYCACDLLAVPSHYESFGLVGLEALACGTPVVSTPVGAMKGLLADGRAGRLVPCRDPAGLAEGIRRVLRGRHGGRYPTGVVRSVALPYDWDVVAGKVESEYFRLLRWRNLGGFDAGALVVPWLRSGAVARRGAACPTPVDLGGGDSVVSREPRSSRSPQGWS